MSPKLPLELKFWWPHNFLKHDARRYLSFLVFLQRGVNRLGVGGLQYGRANRLQRYADRARVELDAYDKDHNLEHLINIFNYAYLESEAPMYSDAHYDNTIDSATRKKFGRGGFIPEHEK